MNSDIQKIDSSKKEYIKFVALYNRKSRGENETDLDKHRSILLEMCETNDWKYVEYSEIETGDSIHSRPIFKALLKDIEDGLYDAVACVDIDRLGRGNKGDQDTVETTFKNSGTLIATPTKIYDLANDDDEFVVDMKSFLARREYKMIVKRLSQGKKVGAKRGDWTNGIPPFPYSYEKWKNNYNAKGLVINEDLLPLYRFMIDSCIKDRMTPSEIAWELNKQKIPSPRGSIWHGNTIARILVDETHLGKIISNKTKGDGHKNKRKTNTDHVISIPREEWVVISNCHKACKSQEEHDQIRAILHNRNLGLTRTTNGKRALSGLVKCGLCGHTMQIIYRPNRKNPESIKPCWYKDHLGNKCPNAGGITINLYDAIKSEIINYKADLNLQLNENEGSQVDFIKDSIGNILKQISVKEKSLNKIHEAYENDIYTIEEFKSRRDKVAREISKYEQDLEIFQIKLKNTQSISIEDKINIIDDLLNDINEDTDKDGNKLNRSYKRIIDSIIWLKVDGEINVSINFL